MVVAAEMMPVGLLTPMGADLGQSEGTVGLTLTITGLVAAISSPLTPFLIRAIDRRLVLIVLMVLVAAANVLTAIASSFAVVSVARVLLAIGMGGVWALAPSIAPRLVAVPSKGLAVTIVFSGVAVASVLGVPTGTFIGAIFGWRFAFWFLSVTAVLIAMLMIVLLPPLPAERSHPSGSLAGVLRIPGVRIGMAITALLVTAHFTAYSYVRPALESFASLSPGLVGAMLLIYGIFGVAGNFTAGPIAARSSVGILLVLALGIATTLTLAPAVATTALGAGIVMIIWGMLYGGVSVTTQTAIQSAAPITASESVSALWSGVFNAGMALGALTGGQIYDKVGARGTLWTAAALAVAATVLTVIELRSRRVKRPLSLASDDDSELEVSCS